AGAIEQVIGQDFAPQILHFLGLGKETMSADIEVITLVVNGAGKTAHVLGVAFQYDGWNVLLGQQISGGQTSRSGTDDRYTFGDHCASRSRGNRGRCSSSLAFFSV